MPDQEPEDVGEPVDRIVATVRTWPGLSVKRQREGRVAFALGARRLGQIRDDRVLDVAFPQEVRDRLVDVDRVEPTRVHPKSGWASFYLTDHPGVEGDERDATPLADAVWLLRVSYLSHALSLSNTPVGGEVLASIQVDPALRDLDLDPTLRSAFDDLRDR